MEAVTTYLLVTGSRLLPADGFLLATLDALHAELDDDLMIVHGQCDPRHPATRRRIPWDGAPQCGIHPDRLLGADWQADRWAAATCLPTDPRPANWAQYGRAAGPIRNQGMVDLLATVRRKFVAAFPLGKSVGTMDCVRRAKAERIPCRVYESGGA